MCSTHTSSVWVCLCFKYLSLYTFLPLIYLYHIPKPMCFLLLGFLSTKESYQASHLEERLKRAAHLKELQLLSSNFVSLLEESVHMKILIQEKTKQYAHTW